MFSSFSDLKSRLLLLVLLILVLPFLFGFGPVQAQTPTPDPGTFVLWGVPWMIVGVVLIGLARKYLNATEEAGVLISAVWAVAGYLVLANLPDLEAVAPWLPKYAPQVLWAVVLFGAQLGLVPGTMASKVKALLVGR